MILILTKAKDIAGNLDLYNKSYAFSIFGKQEWECLGFSKTGNKVKFRKIKVLENGKLQQINRYVDPEEEMITL